MRKLARVPSSHFPDYLKLDLAVGTPEASPLVRALDEAALTLSERAFAMSWRVSPAVLAIAPLRAHLEGLGFVTTPLEDDEVYALFDLLDPALDEAESLDTLRAVATLYLGPCDVRRGRPIVAKPLAAEGVRQLVLQDSQSTGEVIFVRTEREVSEARREAYRRTCDRHFPEGAVVEIAAPLRARVVIPAGFDLSEPARLAGRRL